MSAFETGINLISAQAPTRFAVRQVLDQELQRTLALRSTKARQARFTAGGGDDTDALPAPSLSALVDKENMAVDPKEATLIKRDFFGRVIEAKPLAELDVNSEKRARREERKVWVTFHEGLNNAVRKPISLGDFLRGL